MEQTQSLIRLVTGTANPVRPVIRRLAAGEVLVKAGTPVIGILVVKEGAIKALHSFRSGEYLRQIAGPGEVLGLMEALGSGRAPAVHQDTLVAVGTAVIEILPIEDVREDRDLLVGLITNGAHHERWKEALRRPFDLLPVRARVAATVWGLADRFGKRTAERSVADWKVVNVIDLDLTRQELAHLAGTVYESVIRTLTSLKKEGVLELEGRCIRVKDEEQLARIGQIVVSSTSYENTSKSHDHIASNNSRPKEASRA